MDKNLTEYGLRKELQAENYTVSQLEIVRRPYREKQLALGAELGMDGIREVAEKKRRNRGLMRNHEKWHQTEEAYLDTRRFVKICDEFIANREKLDKFLIDPESFSGLLDAEFADKKRKEYHPPFVEPELNEKFMDLIQGLRAIRRSLGLGDISEEEAMEQAQNLEADAGLKNVFSTDSQGSSTILKTIKEEIDSLGFHPNYPSYADGGEKQAARSELQAQEMGFMKRVKDILELKKIKPVRLNFEKMVAGIQAAIPGAALTGGAFKGKPHLRSTAVEIFENAVNSDSELRSHIEAVVSGLEDALLNDAHVVIEHDEKDSDPGVEPS